MIRFPIATVALSLLLAFPVGAQKQVGERAFIGGREHAGEVLDADLPGEMHIKNIGSRVDGFGMCVMSSIEMAALYQGMDQYRGLRDFCAKEPGGGWPEKVDRQIAAFCRSKNLPEPRYVQYEGPDVEPIIEAACRSGRIACCTLGTGERYEMATIAHMVCCVKYSGQWATILDNNHPGEQAYEWMPKSEAIRRIKFPRNVGWVFVWLASPPPPSPRN